MSIFSATEVLLPKKQNMSQWAVIACDQFTSQPEYWEEAQRQADASCSTMQLILPECYLQGDYSGKIKKINATMRQYLEQDVFQVYPDSYVYVERTLLNGCIRRGILGVVDLEEYSYAATSHSRIRATEQTVMERIPPRVAIREHAPIELPHIILFCNDVQDLLLGPCEADKDSFPLLYDFDLMCDGGHIQGRLLTGAAKAALDERFAAYCQACEAKYGSENAVILAVGDGNHSLATAKACYERLKAAGETPARYAMVELENIQDEAQAFEPIHRVLTQVDEQALLQALQQQLGVAEGYPVLWYTEREQGVVNLDPRKGKLAVKILQDFLDSYLADHEGCIDYIHGEEAVRELSHQPHALGFILPPFDKAALFDSIYEQGPLPRKTFSIGHAKEKRYYLEARRIK